jgi:uncharacterized membrane protein YfcA
MTPPERRVLAMQAAWNLRALALFLIGPVIGVWLGAAIFGMPRNLQIAAAVAFLFSVAMFVMLIRGEWKRLSRGR